VVLVLLTVKGIKIGESRVENIERLHKAGIKAETMLLRSPSSDKLDRALEHADTILVSERSLLNMLINKSSSRDNRFIYMVDTGDLREGVWFEKAVSEISKAIDIEGIEIVGIGTNLGCFGGVLPTEKNMNLMIEIKNYLEEKLNKKLIVSAGNTVALKLLEEGKLPEGINQYRVGEALLLGTDATGHREIPYLSQDTVILEAEVVELDYKPSVPVGKIGRDSMGRIPKFEDKGWRNRIILAIGEQDIDSSGLKPFDLGINVLHASSDHTIADISESSFEYNVGDIVKFRLSYGSALRAFTSPFVEKVYK